MQLLFCSIIVTIGNTATFPPLQAKAKLMDVQYSSADTYPVSKSITVGDITIEAGAGADAFNRISDFLHVTLGYNEDGEFNESSDPFINDVKALYRRYSIAHSTVEAIASGAFTSTDENPQYAGGVVTPSHRIFTPQEAAKNGLESIAKH
jgi:hypothetical protein